MQTVVQGCRVVVSNHLQRDRPSRLRLRVQEKQNKTKI